MIIPIYKKQCGKLSNLETHLMTYDSTEDTTKHVEMVQKFIDEFEDALDIRWTIHDGSKFEEPEKSAYDILTPRLKDLTYGSDEYKACLREMAPAIQHHYENNSHHPEHYENGINGMTLVDVVEMLCDWKAAGMRHSDGSIQQSLEINRKRFNISDQLFEILQNTVKEFGW